ncbi:MAG: hypothetical protein U1F36_00025 [Planctomycetota bacterium]
MLSPPTVVSHTAGLDQVDGEWIGVGDGYKVALRTDGFEFVPALGDSAPHDFPIAYQLVAIERDGAAMPPTGAEPRRAGLRLEYDRGRVIQRYDVGADGVEQSFVFTERPAGRGDLVVRGRLRTELEIREDGDGLRFTLPDVGHCTMSGVIGVDAEGRQVKGRLHYADGVLELSLPASFVDSAALPFVLDPLLSGASAVSGTGGGDDRNPNVAYNPVLDRFLVVWERALSATNHDVYGQALTRNGVPTGPALLIETGTANATSPQIANCGATGAYVVVFVRGADIVGRAINAVLTMGTAALIGDSGGVRTESHSSPCLATDLAHGSALCVWQRNTATPSTDHIIRAANIGVGPSLSLTVGPIRDVVRGTTVSRPRLCKSDRGRDRFAIAYQRTNPTNLVDSFLLLIDGSGAALTPPQLVPNATSASPEPEVDGDGSNWLISYRAIPFPFQIEYIAGAAYSFSPEGGGQLMTTGDARIVSVSNDVVAPRVVWIADSCLVGYAELLSASGTSMAGISSRSIFRCTDCEAQAYVGASTRVEGPPVGCSVHASGGTGEDVLLTWEQALAGNGDIVARRWLAVDGDITSLGGGCGRGGLNYTGCARSPNPFFAHRMIEGLPSAPVVLVLSIGQAGLQCGSCNLIPDLTTSITMVTTTDVFGSAVRIMPIPTASPLVGLPLFTQWATVDVNAPACTLLSVHLSDALRFVIQ